MKGVLATWIALGVVGAGSAVAQPAPPPEREGARRFLARDRPVKITSDRLTVFNKENRAVFLGRVVARQGDLVIRCEELVAHSLPNGGLSTLTALRKVRLRKGERRAVGERLDYDHARRVLVLTGAPRLWEKENQLEGERVVFFLDEDRVEVERARGNLKVEERR